MSTKERERGVGEPSTSLPSIWRPLLKGFLTYGRFYMRRHFHALRLTRADRPMVGVDEPMLIYTNHPSWWDPMVILAVAYRLFPRRDHYGPIDREALERYGFMRRIGLLGIEPGTSSGARRYLRWGTEAASHPERAFLVTAQGRFTDPRERPAHLAPGLGHLVSRLDRGVVLPMALEYPFWEERLPEALVRFGPAVRIEEEWSRSPSDWTALFEDRLVETQDLLARDARERRVERFETLLEGSAGVGGVYDVWRRFKALLTGRSFRPEHGTVRR